VFCSCKVAGNVLHRRIHWNIKSSPASPGRSRVGPALYIFSLLDYTTNRKPADDQLLVTPPRPHYSSLKPPPPYIQILLGVQFKRPTTMTVLNDVWSMTVLYCTICTGGIMELDLAGGLYCGRRGSRGC
jgi:hypothetical protein